MSKHTEEEIREAFKKISERAIGHNDHVLMSIPPQPNDADIVMSDALEELFELRRLAKTLPDHIFRCAFSLKKVEEAFRTCCPEEYKEG